MKINVNFKKLKASDPIKEYTQEKLTRELDKFNSQVESIEVVISPSGRNYSASCHVKGSSNSSFVAEGLGEETHSAVDNMIKKIDHLLRKNKEKTVKHRAHHAGNKEYQDYSFENSYLEEKEEKKKKKKRS